MNLKLFIRFKNLLLYLCFLLLLLLLSTPSSTVKEDPPHKVAVLSEVAKPLKLVTQGSFPSVVMVT